MTGCGRYSLKSPPTSDAELKECDGEHDHVHLLIEYPPTVAVSRMVNSLKGVSSRLLREAVPQHPHPPQPPLVAQLLRCLLRWRTTRDHQDLHPEPTNSGAAYPALKDGACAAQIPVIADNSAPQPPSAAAARNSTRAAMFAARIIAVPAANNPRLPT